MMSLDQLLESLLNEQDEEDYGEKALGLDYVMNEPTRKKIPHGTMNLFKNEGYHNILATLKKASKEEIDYWSNWYQYAHGHVSELASKYGIDTSVAAAVCAVLSPNLGWKMNLLAASRILDNWMHLGGAEGYQFWDKIPAYKTNQNKAMKILETGDLSIVKGPKVSVFFHSLENPDRVERELVLDGHAINVWRGIKTPLKNMKSPNRNERKAIIYDYRKVADLVGLTPQQVQAVTWFIWKYVTKPPKIKGKVHVEQPAMKEARRLLGFIIKEEVAKLLNL